MKSIYTIIILTLALLGTQIISAQNFQKRETEKNTFQTRMKVDGLERNFLVHLPPAYNPKADKVWPVVFMLHGGGGTGQKMYNITKWKELGDREGFITVFPTAYRTCIIKDGQRSTKNYWMTEGKALAVCPGTTVHDDVKFMREIVAHLKSNYNVDASRFYASGFSNGMGMTLSRLLVDMGDTFAALAGVGSLIRQSYESSQIVPVFSLIGQNDTHMQQWAGISQPMDDVHELLDDTELPTKVGFILETMNLEDNYVERNRPKYILRRYTETNDGGSQELRFGIIKELGHVYPHGGEKHNDIVIAEVFWDFFKEYSK